MHHLFFHISAKILFDAIVLSYKLFFSKKNTVLDVNNVCCCYLILLFLLCRSLNNGRFNRPSNETLFNFLVD